MIVMCLCGIVLWLICDYLSADFPVCCWLELFCLVCCLVLFCVICDCLVLFWFVLSYCVVLSYLVLASLVSQYTWPNFIESILLVFPAAVFLNHHRCPRKVSRLFLICAFVRSCLSFVFFLCLVCFLIFLRFVLLCSFSITYSLHSCAITPPKCLYLPVLCSVLQSLPWSWCLCLFYMSLYLHFVYVPCLVPSPCCCPRPVPLYLSLPYS